MIIWPEVQVFKFGVGGLYLRWCTDKVPHGPNPTGQNLTEQNPPTNGQNPTLFIM